MNLFPILKIRKHYLCIRAWLRLPATRQASAFLSVAGKAFIGCFDQQWREGSRPGAEGSD